MWAPVEELRKMSKDERLGYLSFTSDDMTEQIVSYLLDFLQENHTAELEIREDLLKQVEFFKEQNKTLQNKCSFFREKVREQANQIERMSEKLRTVGLTNEGS